MGFFVKRFLVQLEILYAHVVRNEQDRDERAERFLCQKVWL